VKNRKLEICTSGSVGGRGGNTPTYPARRGLETTEHAARAKRRPALTAPVRAGLQHVWVGAKKRDSKSNKETGKKEVKNAGNKCLTSRVPYKGEQRATQSLA
jgi:hypothetical protein